METYRAQRARLNTIACEVGVTKPSQDGFSRRIAREFGVNLLLCKDEAAARALMQSEAKAAGDFLTMLDIAYHAMVEDFVREDGDQPPPPMPFFLSGALVADLIDFYEEQTKG